MAVIPKASDGTSNCLLLCKRCGSTAVALQLLRPVNFVKDSKGRTVPTVRDEALRTDEAVDAVKSSSVAYCAACLRATELVAASEAPRAFCN